MRNHSGSSDNKFSPSAEFKAWIYIRYSEGDNQTAESQIMAGKNYCQVHNLEIDRIFRDDWTSGRSTDNREAFMLMVAQAKLDPKPAKTIVMYDMKRFARNSDDGPFYRSMLRREGWKLVFIEDKIPEDPFLGRLMEVVLDLMAEQQLYDIRAGTIRGLRFIAEQGCLPIGQPAVGYVCVDVPLGGVKKDGTLRMGRKPEIDPRYALKIRTAFELKARGAPIRIIEKETKLFLKYGAKGNKTEPEQDREDEPPQIISGSWNHLFTNRAYAGEFVFQGEIFHDVYPALVSKQLFDAVQKTIPPQKIVRRNISDHPRRKHSAYLLANLAFCGYCGAPMHGKSMLKKKSLEEGEEESYRFYICSQHNKDSQNCIESSFIKANDVEEQLFDLVRDQVLKTDYMVDLLHWTNEQLNIESETLLLNIEELKNRLENEDRTYEKMIENFNQLNRPTRRIEEKLHQQEDLVDRITAELESLVRIYKDSHVETSNKVIEKFVHDTNALLDANNHFDKRAVYERLIDRIVMYKDKCVIFMHFPVSE